MRKYRIESLTAPVTLATRKKARIGDALEIERAFAETKVHGKVDDSIIEKPKDPSEPRRHSWI